MKLRPRKQEQNSLFDLSEPASKGVIKSDIEQVMNPPEPAKKRATNEAKAARKSKQNKTKPFIPPDKSKFGPNVDVYGKQYDQYQAHKKEIEEHIIIINNPHNTDQDQMDRLAEYYDGWGFIIGPPKTDKINSSMECNYKGIKRQIHRAVCIWHQEAKDQNCTLCLRCTWKKQEIESQVTPIKQVEIIQPKQASLFDMPHNDDNKNKLPNRIKQQLKREGL